MDEQHSLYHDKLLQMRQQLEATSEASNQTGDQATVTLDQTSVGRLSRVDALQGQQMALEQQRRRQQKLMLIDAAMRRLDNGEFGLCRDCDEPIAPARLSYDPSVLYCVHCAEQRTNSTGG